MTSTHSVSLVSSIHWIHSMDDYSIHSIHSIHSVHSVHSMDAHSIHSVHSMDAHSIHLAHSTHLMTSTLPIHPRLLTPSTLSTLSTSWLAPHSAARWPPAPYPHNVRAADALPAWLAALPSLLHGLRREDLAAERARPHLVQLAQRRQHLLHSISSLARTGVSSMCDDVKQREIRTLNWSSEFAIACRSAGSRSGNSGENASIGWHYVRDPCGKYHKRGQHEDERGVVHR